jgi:hypothetical protein
MTLSALLKDTWTQAADPQRVQYKHLHADIEKWVNTTGTCQVFDFIIREMKTDTANPSQLIPDSIHKGDKAHDLLKQLVWQILRRIGGHVAAVRAENNAEPQQATLTSFLNVTEQTQSLLSARALSTALTRAGKQSTPVVRPRSTSLGRNKRRDALKRGAPCFNCGAAGHLASACPKPRDPEHFKQASKRFAKKQ